MADINNNNNNNGEVSPKVDADNVAQLFIQLLEHRGVPVLFCNSGTDFTPIIDALAKYDEKLRLKVVLCPHENTVIAMAHGYSLVSGKLTALMNHVSVGTANMGCGIINASRSKVPLLVCAGRTPWFDYGIPGSRTNFVQWGQDAYDQEGMFREYFKWYYQLKHPHHLDVVFDRALAIAQSEPKGPVYLTLPKEVLLMSTTATNNELISPVPHMTPDLPTVAADESLEKVISLLANAKHPLLITAELGRHPGGPDSVLDFCKRFGVGLVEFGKRNFFNCNTEEDIHLGFDPIPFLPQADVILCVESQVPWIPNFGTQPAWPQVPVIQIGAAPLYPELPMRAFPATLSVAGNPVLTLRRLSQLLQQEKGASSVAFSDSAAVQSRLVSLAEAHRRVYTEARESARKEGQQIAAEGAGTDITKRFLSYCIGRALDNEQGDNTIVFNEYPLDHALVPRRKPNSWFENSNASGLGWSFGACLGGKLARPDATVVCAVGDGSFLFNSPLSCHFTATEHKIPVLVIIFNDQGYSTIKKSVLGSRGQNTSCEQTQKFRLCFFERCDIDYAKVAEACGAIGKRVTRASELMAAIEEGLEAVRTGDKHYVLDVRCLRD